MEKITTHLVEVQVGVQQYASEVATKIPKVFVSSCSPITGPE